MSTGRRLIIVGGGVAAVRAALGARAVDEALTITVLAGEDVPPYDRTSLSKDIITRSMSVADFPLVSPDDLEKHAITLVQNAQVESADADRRTVTTRDGQQYGYDVLIVATGTTPRRLPTPGADDCGVLYLRDWADAQEIRSRLGAAGHLVVIGAGLIGLEVAAAARELGLDVDVLEMAPGILGRSCDPHTAAAMAALHREHGVRLHTDCRVDAMESLDGTRTRLALANGDTLDADLVVAGIGVVPDTAIAEQLGLGVADGVLVDDRGRTSDPAIYAAGDVARLPLPYYPEPVRLETWRHAQDHGDLVGRNAAGGDQAYSAPPQFWSDQFGHRLQGVGMPGDGVTETVIRTYDDGPHTSFMLDDRRHVRAAIGMDKPQDINAARRLVEADVPVDPELLSDAALPVARIVKQLRR